ncbi:MAG: methyl-accepting chemotaxis protein [Solirubrobacterales bacterium]
MFKTFRRRIILRTGFMLFFLQAVLFVLLIKYTRLGLGADGAIGASLWKAAALFALFWLTGITVTYFILFRGLKPLERLSLSAEQIRLAGFEERINVMETRPTELPERAFAGVSALLDKSIEVMEARYLETALSIRNLSASFLNEEIQSQAHITANRDLENRFEEAIRQAITAIGAIGSDAAKLTEPPQDPEIAKANLRVNAAIERIRIIDRTLQEMSRIAREAVTGVEEVKDSSDRINEVLALIKSIADEANHLSVRAAMEAAQAGEYGRQFAEVADEIRNLGDSVQRSTRSITGILDRLCNSTDAVAASIQQVDQAAARGSELIQDLVDQTGETVSVVEEASPGVDETITRPEEPPAVTHRLPAGKSPLIN